MARRAARVVAVGDAIVDRITPPIPPLPHGDFQGHIESFEILPGGNATNFALQIAALGARTTFVGRLGRDADADVLQRAYQKHGVRALVRSDPRRPTGATVAVTWKGGGRALITSLGANGGLQLRDISPSHFRGADHVHRAGFWWTPRLIGRPTAILLERARRAGANTSLDMSTDPQGWTKEHVRGVQLALPQVDTFFGNDIEVSAIGRGSSTLSSARQIVRLGAKEVVIHSGERGSASVTRTGVVKASAFSVPVDNPTGCGDVFNAAYVYARLDGERVQSALRFANACSALHLADRRRPYAGLAEVRRFLASRFASR